MARRTEIYWRPTRISGTAHMVIVLSSLLALLAAENLTRQGSAEHYDEMVAAARVVQSGIETLRPMRGAIEPIDPAVDPQRSGMIGIAASSVTSNSGHLESKQATVNPNWGGAVVKMLKEVGIGEGDTVAVAASGSFPAMNLAVYAALETIGARPLVIASGSASEWGANVPGFLWVDMAAALRDADILKTRAIAATLGGREDRGLGIPEDGLSMIRNSIDGAGLELLVPESYEEAVALRIATYEEAADGARIAALVNVGGGTATTGPAEVDHYFSSGIQQRAPSRAFAIPSVMGHFIRADVPVIHLSGISTLAQRYGLPYPPREAPAIGSGGVYETITYRRWLAALLIVCLIAITAFVMRAVSGPSALIDGKETGGGTRAGV